MTIATIVTFLFFTALVGVITWFLTRKDDHGTSTGYFLAGRTLTGGFIAGSLLLTNLSTEQLVGLNGAAFSDGIAVMCWEVIAGASLVIMALYFLPKYLRSGITTIPEFFEKRFNPLTRAITSFIFILAYAVILLPMILYTGATGLTQILDLKTLTGIESHTTLLWISIWFIGIIGSIYAIFGGLRTVAVSDTINGFGLLLGGILITVFALSYGHDGGAIEGVIKLKQEHPEKFNSVGGSDSSVPFSTLFTGVLLLNLFYWTTNQQIIQRTFGASSLKEGQKGVLVAGVFKVLAPLILVIPGIVAFSVLGHMTSGEGESAQQLPIKDITTEDIAFIGTATEDGKSKTVILHGKDAAKLLGTGAVDQAQGKVGQTITDEKRTIQVEKILGPDVAILEQKDENGGTSFIFVPDTKAEEYAFARNSNQAYGQLVRKVMPGGFFGALLAGFFAAAVVGAVLSSFNSALNSTATLFSLGVYQHFVKKGATDDRKVIINGKIVGAIAAVLAMSTAPLLDGQESIFGYLQDMNALYFIPIFSVVLAGFLFKHANAAAANISLLAGCVLLSLGYWVPPFSEWAGAVHKFHFMGIVFGALMVFQIVMSLVAPRSEPWVQEHSGDVDLTPWKWAKPVGIGIVVFVLALYLAFADFSILSAE
ncbi:MAG: SSS family transporter [Verrucomicrobiales bacterium]|jgi:SSS family transporter